MRFGPAIEEALRILHSGKALLDDDRGDACGLLLGGDEPLGYLGVPDEFRPFLAWGVDGVHEGFWLDAPDQTHSPYIVMVSPMDTDAIEVEARDAGRWLDLLRLGYFNDHWDAWEEESAAAIEQRRSLGFRPIPVQYDLPDD